MPPKEQQPEYLAVAHLKGVAIGVREGGLKYHVQPRTISGWIKKGYIQTMGCQAVRGGYKFMLDEADLAYCAALYHHDPRMGRKIFNSDGSPYRTS